ncbi:glycoside hydrolase family 3 protein [Aulographum hederae CBS 113979]|uniref:xylan 1,4-beta-xylosidase n=1 Tax=Aulographum hederae CBS 113979 TaxID=1176131 RepID=A0A6G1H8Y0_9PEZI|nr:glycoside hydrolase family 3 protein [Aulographum hederae CBS 113979]
MLVNIKGTSVLSTFWLFTVAQAAFPDCVSGPLKSNTVCDVSATPLERATALIKLFTLEEKLNNTGNDSPGVPRLGLPPYQWWSEALHGVADSPGVEFSESGDYSIATSFPQPILMGAAFDDELITAVGTVVSTEARAFNNANRTGLDFWTPNINPFRDPRWGRGQETPGEDPFHLSSYVHALIEGLQGSSNDKYKRVVATCKHFAGYDMENWNGNYRYKFDAQIGMQELVEYFLPTFQTCARDSNVGAFMCTYNALNGVPTCADPWLLQTILREHWNWTSEEQWVTSDCDSIQNIFLPHEYTSTREGAAAAALNAGTDIDCGTYYQHHLPKAYEQGLINDTTLTTALVRQYSSLVRLGYFDPPSEQPYRYLNFGDVNTPHAQELAYRAAVEGITLLKNDGLLPLKPGSFKSIALIGEWANATDQMQGNYKGIAPYLHSPLWAAEQLNVTVNYAQGPGGRFDPTTNSWLPVWSAAEKSDVIIYVGGIDNNVESEEKDRVDIGWFPTQLDMIGELAQYEKPVIVVQMGAGQIDSSPIVNNENINALLWAGYPGQDGGVAILDIITGKKAPAGRLPTTQYPANYVSQVPMTDMSLRPGPNNPGRTYMWYTGTPIFEFGFGLHYTNFTASIESATTNTTMTANTTTTDLIATCKALNPPPPYLDRCPFTTLPITITNTGTVTSDYSTLAFLSGSFGPSPRPNKSLVAYQRLHDIAPGESKIAMLNLTLASLSRVDESGNRVLYPGEYRVRIDVGEGVAEWGFTLGGEEVVLDEWPQPPAREGGGETPLGDYFLGDFGSGVDRDEL